MKIRHLLFVFLVLWITLVSLYSFFINSGNTVVPITLVSSIDSLYWGDGYSSLNSNYITKENNENKDIKKLTNLSNEIFLPIDFDVQNTKYFFDNLLFDQEQVTLLREKVEDNYYTLKYNQENQQILINKPVPNFFIDDTIIDSEITKYLINDIKKDEYIEFGNTLYQVSKINEIKPVIKASDIKSNKLSIYTKSNQDNLLSNQNNDFSTGFWTEEIGFCDPRGVINTNQQANQKIIKNDSGGNLLELSSENTFGCTSKRFDVDFVKDNYYSYEVKYKNIKGGKFRSFVKMEYDETVVVSDTNGSREVFLGDNFVEEFDIESTNEFQEFKQVIKTNKDSVSKFLVFLYSPASSKEVINLFESVSLYPIERGREAAIEPVQIENLEYLNNNYNAIYNIIPSKKNLWINISTTDQNMLSDLNPSFEEGLWQSDVRNCTRSLPGVPQLTMNLHQNATDGNNSLKLSSRNQYACTAKNFNVILSPIYKYKIDFDYNNITGKELSFFYKLESGEDVSKTFIDGVQVVETQNLSQQESFDFIAQEDNKWEKKSFLIEPDIPNIQQLTVAFYAKSIGDKEVTNLYDNLSLSPVAPLDIENYILYYKNENRQIDINNINQVEYKEHNPNHYSVRISNLKSPKLLFFPKTYNKSWFLQTNSSGKNNNIEILPAKYKNSTINNQLQDDSFAIFNTSEYRIPEELHFQLNGYGNAWLIDPNSICDKSNENICTQNQDGSYNINLTIKNSRFPLSYFQFTIYSLIVFILILISTIYLHKIYKNHN